MSRRDAGRLRGGQRKPGVPAVQASGMKHLAANKRDHSILCLFFPRPAAHVKWIWYASRPFCSRRGQIWQGERLSSTHACLGLSHPLALAGSRPISLLLLPPLNSPHCQRLVPAFGISHLHTPHSPAPSGSRPTAAAAGSPGSSCAAPACPARWQQRWSRHTCGAAGAAETQEAGRQGSRDARQGACSKGSWTHSDRRATRGACCAAPCCPMQATGSAGSSGLLTFPAPSQTPCQPPCPACREKAHPARVKMQALQAAGAAAIASIAAAGHGQRSSQICSR